MGPGKFMAVTLQLYCLGYGLAEAHAELLHTKNKATPPDVPDGA